MLEYQGQPCMICGDAFSEADDIVTCPECGTPYHRACYKKVGCCVNTELHETGGSWVTERRRAISAELRAEKRAEQEEQAAERERGDAPKMLNGSLYDGVRLNPYDPCVGLDPEETLDGATMREVAEFVGTNRFYYLPRFRLMKQTGRKFSFNLVCLFFPHFYFANRKMWVLTIGSMLLEMLLGIPRVLVYMYEQLGISVSWANVNSAGFARLDSVCSVVGLIVSAFWGLFANYLYYRHTVRRIRSIKRGAGSEAAMHDRIQTEGGTNGWNIVLTLVIEVSLAAAFVYIVTMLR
ncbi:MAG: DUF2628 domain-containing protein [Oscillospiraceae bacterium]|nr:DUF2628 domain-containing protein [Oscillospiraceae bacterium]